MRTLVKGGVWKNTEDEILKAAVMKYGKNQWSRISSLLVRKTAKQCKARWYEWLDPSIKKTEWSREEDEKLLHLAKLMPCQWRTIAPIVGRTAAQCFNRYERLLDEAQGKETVVGEDDPRKLRPGEIDPAPEIKPARPDPVDMDEDEKEMLSEARARLANTQGKKAKRKAREKQLEEARRLASLQKKRELKAAGIQVHDHSHRKKRKTVDYNAEIPFHKPAPLGFYDMASESKRTTHVSLTGQRLDQIEGKRRDEQEEEQRKRDIKRTKEMEKQRASMLVSALKRDQQKQTTMTASRPKLNLPTPQISEQELKEIIKLGYEGENRKSAVISSSTGKYDASAALLGNYSTIAPTPLRTPRAPSSLDTVKLEAQNLMALQHIQTPLLGGVNPLLHHNTTSFEGITPRHHVASTPSLLKAAASTPAHSILMGMRTQIPSSPAMTRDGFQQTPLSSSNVSTMSSEDYSSTLTTMESTVSSKRRRFLDGLHQLPQPKNEFEIEISDEHESVDDKPMEERNSTLLLDFQEEEKKKKKKKEKEEEEEEKQRHIRKQLLDKEHASRMQRLISKALHIPKIVMQVRKKTMGLTETKHLNGMEIADELVQREIMKLLDLDLARTMHLSSHSTTAIAYPSSSSSSSLEEGGATTTLESMNAFEPEELHQASLYIEEESKAMTRNQLEPHDGGPIHITLKDYEALWHECHRYLVLSLDRKEYILAQTNLDKVAHLQHEFTHLRANIFRDAQQAAKLEDTLKRLLDDYQSRADDLLHQISEETFQSMEQTRIEWMAMQSLYDLERDSIPRRIETLQKELQLLNQSEATLMGQYRDLISQRDTFLTIATAQPSMS
jgi:pre-mRNA-splicing factor CDC5/CEF1